MRRRVISVWVFLLIGTSLARAQVAPVVSEIQIEQEGRVIEDQSISGLIATPTGAPLSMRQVRDTVAHLTSLNRFEDVRVLQEATPAGIRLRYVLVPLHPVDRLAFRGTLGVSENEVRDVIVERFGEAPSAGRMEEVQEALRLWYRDRGYVTAQITPSIEETHNPDRATMVFDIVAGVRARIGRLEITVIGGGQQEESQDIGVSVGDVYDNDEVVRALDEFVADLRGRGYYEAQSIHTPLFEPDGSCHGSCVHRARSSRLGGVCRRSAARGPSASASCRCAPKDRPMKISLKMPAPTSRTTSGCEGTVTPWSRTPERRPERS